MEPQLQTGLLADPVSKKHETGPAHPESPRRYDAIWKALTNAHLPESTAKVPIHEAAEDDIARVHSLEYIQSARQDIANMRSQLRTGDTAISTHSWEVAMHAVSSAMGAVYERHALR